MATVTLRPSADTVDADWSPDSGGVHYTRVNEAVADEDTTYVLSFSAGDLDLYEVPDDVPAGVTSISVEVFCRARSGGADPEKFYLACKSGATVNTPTEKTASGASYSNYSSVFATAPDGGAWTVAKANAMKIGVFSSTLVNALVVTQVWAVVTYTVLTSATGTPSLPHLTATAAAKLAQKATGAPVLPHMTAVGSGLMKPKGTVTATLPHLTVMGLGGQGRNVGFVVVNLPHLTAVASGYEKPVGTIDVRLPHLTAVVSGYMKPAATGAPHLPHLTATAAGLFKYTASGTPHLPHLTAAATGLKGAAVGHAAPTLAHLVATSAGNQHQTATGSATLGHLRAAATGGVPERATGAATLPHLTSTSNGIFHFRANFAPNAGGRVYS